MKRLAASLVLALIATAVHAGTRSCTSTMVSLNICRTTNDVAYCLPISTVDPDSGGPRLAPSALVADALANLNGWQATMACSQEMVDATICTAGQLGQSVSVTKAKFADMILRRWVLEQVRRYREQQEAAAAAALVVAEPVPDLGN